MFKIEGDVDDDSVDSLGNILFGITVFGFIAIVAVIIGVLFKRVEKVRKFVDKVKNKICFTVFITTIVKGYMNLCMKMLNQLTGGGPPFISRSQTEIELAKSKSPTIPLVIFGFLSLMPFIVSFVVRANASKLSEEKFKASYGALYTGLKTDRAERYSFNFFFMMRRMIYAICINSLLVVTF